MFLYETFPPELIKIELEAEDKEEVFEELVDLYCRSEKGASREDVLKAIRQREAKMSTGVYKGIAIPHARIAGIDRVRGILGVSKKGIDYDALDGLPVYVVFMLLTPLMDPEGQLQPMVRLAALIKNYQFYQDLMEQKDPRGANAILKKYENSYITSE